MMSDLLTFSCPHCEHRYEDELEILAEGELHQFKCENCELPFVVLVKECHRCAAETVTVFGEAPTWEAVALLKCQTCGTAYAPAEELEEDK